MKFGRGGRGCVDGVGGGGEVVTKDEVWGGGVGRAAGKNCGYGKVGGGDKWEVGGL